MRARPIAPATRCVARRLPAAAAAALLLAAAAAGCDRGPGPGGRPADTGAHSDAMAPGNELDPPQLADLPVVGHSAGVPVLCYHYFRGGFAPGYALRVLGSVLFGLPALGPREFWTTPAAEFERHLRHFRDEGISIVTLDEVADLLAAGQAPPARAVVITIDDADRSVHRHAFPLLRRYGARAHVFVPTARVGSAWSGLRVCDAGELREMAASGHVLLDSHTHDLHFKVKDGGGMLPAFLAKQAGGEGESGRVARDLAEGLAAVRSLGGDRQPWLAWPYGFATPALDSLAVATGFRGTASLSPRRFGPADRDLRVGRFTLTAHTTLAQVRELVRPRP